MTRVLLVCQPGAAPAGACCRRHDLAEASAAAGARLSTVAAPGWRWRRPWRRTSRLRHAGPVVAESVDAAVRARQAGLPRSALWVLATPPERWETGEPGVDAAGLAAVAPQVAGFLTRDEPARESVERALSTVRCRVEVLPRAASGRPCPGCGGGGAAEPATPPPPRLPWGAAGEPADPAEPAPARTAPGSMAHGSSAVRTVRVLLAADGAARPDAADAGTADGGAPHPRLAGRADPTRPVLVTGFDLKFTTDLAGHLEHRPDLHITVDEWPALDRRNSASPRLARRAQSILAEWVRPSTAWLARRKRRDQFLVTRLHRYELETRYPHDVLVDNLDAVVYIAPAFGRRIRSELGWPTDKLVYIPNYVDVPRLARPKLPGARYALGLVGMDVARKRFDLALDLLARLRAEDPRFTLVVRSTMPWHNPYVWDKPTERAFAARCFERLERDPRLRHGVVFDPPGRDMARWYRRIGFLLSCSDAEGSHLAVAEGMASGAVPVLRPWPGAEEVYDKQWISDSVEAAAEAVRESAEPDIWQLRAEEAREEVARTHDPAAVVAAWAQLLHGDVTGARAHFARYSTAPPEPAAPSQPAPPRRLGARP